MASVLLIPVTTPPLELPPTAPFPAPFAPDAANPGVFSLSVVSTEVSSIATPTEPAPADSLPQLSEALRIPPEAAGAQAACARCGRDAPGGIAASSVNVVATTAKGEGPGAVLAPTQAAVGTPNEVADGVADEVDVEEVISDGFGKHAAAPVPVVGPLVGVVLRVREVRASPTAVLGEASGGVRA